MLERTPRRAECLARRGQSLASTLSMDTVYAYLAGVLTEASLRQRPGVARRAAVAEKSRLVTKQNFFTFIPPAKRPWIECADATASPHTLTAQSPRTHVALRVPWSFVQMHPSIV
eukprot:5220429-Pleurochrysis_carterae.AAC.1